MKPLRSLVDDGSFAARSFAGHSPSQGQVAASVSQRKAKHPELYCPSCLWMTGGGACPRHGGPAWSKERQAEADAKSRAVKSTTIVLPLLEVSALLHCHWPVERLDDIPANHEVLSLIRRGFLYREPIGNGWHRLGLTDAGRAFASNLRGEAVRS